MLHKHAEDFFKRHLQEQLFHGEENAAVRAVCEDNFEGVKNAIEKNPEEVRIVLLRTKNLLNHFNPEFHY